MGLEKMNDRYGLHVQGATVEVGTEIIRPRSVERISTTYGPGNFDIFDRMKKVFDMRILTMPIERRLVSENRNNGSRSFRFIKNNDIEAQASRFVLTGCC